MRWKIKPQPVSRLTSWSLFINISDRPLATENSRGLSTAPRPDKAKEGRACSDISKPPESIPYLGSGHFTEKATQKLRLLAMRV